VTITLLFAVPLCVFVHEIGHAVTVKLLSRPVFSITFAPGVQIYPELKRVPWNGSFLGKVDFDKPSVPWQLGVIRLMGCGTTALLSYGIIGSVFFVAKRRRMIIAILRITATVFAWDILIYSVMPELGLQHFIFFGGSVQEPVEAAQLLAIPSPMLWTLLAFHAAAFHVLVWQSGRHIRHDPPNMKTGRMLPS